MPFVTSQSPKRRKPGTLSQPDLFVDEFSPVKVQIFLFFFFIGHFFFHPQLQKKAIPVGKVRRKKKKGT